ncbi:MAG: hypothetical protein HRF42_09730 [Candidatus Brocadia sp.]
MIDERHGKRGFIAGAGLMTFSSVKIYTDFTELLFFCGARSFLRLTLSGFKTLTGLTHAQATMKPALPSLPTRSG